MKLKTKTLLISQLFLFLSCADQASQKYLNEPTAADIQRAQEASINKYFMGVTDWSVFSPLKSDKREKNGTARNSLETAQEGNEKIPVSCVTQDYDLTKTPEKIVMQNPAAGVLYPGALIQGDGYLQGPGGLRELPIRKRAPIIIATDLANQNNAVQVEKLNFAAYQEAYAALLKAASQHNLPRPAKLTYKQLEVSSSEQAALDLGISVKYMGDSIKGSLKTKSSLSETTFMVYFEQNAFTVSAVAPATPAGFFSSDFTEQDLNKQIELGNLSPKNPPLYVSSVNYGRVLVYTITSKAKKEDIQAAINGSYNKGVLEVDASVKGKYQKIMNESKVEIIAFGGDYKYAKELIRSGNLKEYFSDDTRLETYTPVSYVLRNIKDNSIAKVSETTKYSTQECTPLPPKSWQVKITIDKVLMHYTGAYSIGEIYGHLELNGYKIWSRTRDEYLSTKNGESLNEQLNQKPIIVDLPMPSRTMKAIPVILNGKFMDNDDYNQDDILAMFNEELGYTVDKKDVLPSGKYSTSTHRNVEIFYTVERIKPVY